MSKKLQFRRGSAAQVVHDYLKYGGTLTQLQTVDIDTSPVGRVLNLAQRINDLKNKYEKAGVNFPIKTYERHNEMGRMYVEYYFDAKVLG